jgi:hypothetical protein
MAKQECVLPISNKIIQFICQTNQNNGNAQIRPQKCVTACISLFEITPGFLFGLVRKFTFSFRIFYFGN